MPKCSSHPGTRAGQLQRLLKRVVLLPLGLVLLVLAPLEWLARVLWSGFFVGLARLFFLLARWRGEPAELVEVLVQTHPVQRRPSATRRRQRTSHRSPAAKK